MGATDRVWDICLQKWQLERKIILRNLERQKDQRFWRLWTTSWSIASNSSNYLHSVLHHKLWVLDNIIFFSFNFNKLMNFMIFDILLKKNYKKKVVVVQGLQHWDWDFWENLFIKKLLKNKVLIKYYNLDQIS